MRYDRTLVAVDATASASGRVHMQAIVPQARIPAAYTATVALGRRKLARLKVRS
jgi:hypothetical protein